MDVRDWKYSKKRNGLLSWVYFVLLYKRLLHIVLFYCFLAEYLLFNVLCTYMLAIVQSESNNCAETLKNWQGTEISIEEVGGSTFSVLSFVMTMS